MGATNTCLRGFAQNRLTHPVSGMCHRHNPCRAPAACPGLFHATHNAAASRQDTRRGCAAGLGGSSERYRQTARLTCDRHRPTAHRLPAAGRGTDAASLPLYSIHLEVRALNRPRSPWASVRTSAARPGAQQASSPLEDAGTATDGDSGFSTLPRRSGFFSDPQSEQGRCRWSRDK